MIRALATIAVVIIHISADPLIDDCRAGGITHFYMLLNVAARFAVPTFVLLSGLGLAISNRQKQGYFGFVWHRLKKIVPAYVVWSVIYSITYGNLNNISDMKRVPLTKIITDLFTGESCYHLYFVPMIVMCYLLYPLIHKWLRTRTGLVAAGIISFTLISLGAYGNTPEWMGMLFDHRNPLYFMFYFALGIYMADHITFEALKDRWKYVTTAALVLCTALVTAIVHHNASASNNIDTGLDSMGPLVMLFTVSVVAWVWSLDWVIPAVVKPFKWISKHSYMIYLSHVLALQVFIMYYPKLGIHGHGAAFGISAFISVILFSLVLAGLSNLWQKTPYAKTTR